MMLLESPNTIAADTPHTQNQWPLQSGRHDTWLSSESSPSLRTDKSCVPVYATHSIQCIQYSERVHIMPISLSFIATTKYLRNADISAHASRKLKLKLKLKRKHMHNAHASTTIVYVLYAECILHTQSIHVMRCISPNVHLVSSALKRKFSINTCKFREIVRWSITVLAQPK